MLQSGARGFCLYAPPRENWLTRLDPSRSSAPTARVRAVGLVVFWLGLSFG